MTDAAARLVVGYGSTEPQEFLLTAQTTTLGRETINQGDDVQGGNAQADYVKLFFHWGVIRGA